MFTSLAAKQNGKTHVFEFAEFGVVQNLTALADFVGKTSWARIFRIILVCIILLLNICKRCDRLYQNECQHSRLDE
jgi:hypothetical protein